VTGGKNEILEKVGIEKLVLTSKKFLQLLEMEELKIMFQFL